MKIMFMLSLLLSANLYAFNPIQFEADQCQRSIAPGSQPGFYSVREPLIYREAGGLSILQKVTFRGESFYLLDTGVKSYPLRSNLKKVRDFVMVNNNAWLIDEHELIEFDGRGRELNRYRYSQTNSKSEKPRGIDLRDDQILVAHGSHGLVSFDLTQRTFQKLDAINTRQDNGQRSLAVSVTWVGSTAYIALTGNTQNAFNGVVVFDLENNKMINASGYRRYRSGVIDPYARIYFHDKSVFLNNGGWIHQLETESLTTKKFTRPLWLPIRHDHQNRNTFLRVRGDFIFERGEVFGCALVERTPTLAQRKI